MVDKYRNKRLYIDPKSSEIAVNIGRSYNTSTLSSDVVKIIFTRRSDVNAVESEWTSYAVTSNGFHHFNIPSEFLSDVDNFPRGFYDGKVYIDECYIGDVELVKAPGRYVNESHVINNDCTNTGWVEPTCDDDQPCNTCTEHGVEGCSQCFNTVYLNTFNNDKGYVEDEIVPE